MKNKIKYDLKFTDIYGNTHRIIKNSESIEDENEEGLHDLIYGFTKLLNLSGWECINDLEVITDYIKEENDCDFYNNMKKHICENANIDEDLYDKIRELEIDFLVENDVI